ncbi:hypothetical protein CYMTET_40731 [Cymbomonas tetramitiformis]|uniref:Xaa-Pro dipeptidyl-peptidase C-terminal domain-containing protein n=2 Tax=Cymbomonas tetramitiformis TaxID=36881 RepID=A0AAE0F2Z7_9CHLO|nr:hypothetical protein CYMTET_40731 [Cymbomonas tetramitiformis]
MGAYTEDVTLQPNQVVKFCGGLTGPKRLDLSIAQHLSAESGGFLNYGGPFSPDNFVWDTVHRWFDRWLRNSTNGIDAESAFNVQVDTGESTTPVYHALGTYPSPQINFRRLHFQLDLPNESDDSPLLQNHPENISAACTGHLNNDSDPSTAFMNNCTTLVLQKQAENREWTQEIRNRTFPKLNTTWDRPRLQRWPSGNLSHLSFFLDSSGAGYTIISGADTLASSTNAADIAYATVADRLSKWIRNAFDPTEDVLISMDQIDFRHGMTMYSEILAGGVHLCGIPSLKLEVLTSTQNQFQLVAYLFDIDESGTGLLLTHGVWTWSKVSAVSLA